MKKIVILIFFLSFVSNGQNNMQFNRVIDTILVVNINPGINMNTFPLNSTELSPSSNKVWKINNITMRTMLQPYIVNCSTGNLYSSGGIFSYVLINDGVNEQPLCPINSSGPTDASTSSGLFDSSSCSDVRFPLWINSTSTITLAVNTTYDDDSDLCTQPEAGSTASVYISLIEFDVIE